MLIGEAAGVAAGAGSDMVAGVESGVVASTGSDAGAGAEAGTEAGAGPDAGAAAGIEADAPAGFGAAAAACGDFEAGRGSTAIFACVSDAVRAACFEPVGTSFLVTLSCLGAGGGHMAAWPMNTSGWAVAGALVAPGVDVRTVSSSLPV